MTRPFGPSGAPVMPGLSKRAEAPTVGCEKLTRVACGPGVNTDWVGARVGVAFGVATAVDVAVGVFVDVGPIAVGVSVAAAFTEPLASAVGAAPAASAPTPSRVSQRAASAQDTSARRWRDRRLAMPGLMRTP